MNVEESLTLKSVTTLTGLDAIICVCLKVCNFLNESSEYFHAFEASHAVFKVARNVSITYPAYEPISIRWEHEAMCMYVQFLCTLVYLNAKRLYYLHSCLARILTSTFQWILTQDIYFPSFYCFGQTRPHTVKKYRPLRQ